VEYIIRSKKEPYQYHTGEGWSANAEDAKRHPSDYMANAVITLHRMDAEPVQYIQNQDAEQPETGGGANDQPQTQDSDSGEQPESR
jgi:hypothetical protein